MFVVKRMKLRNPFTNRTRVLFIDNYECWKCGTNGGGSLELHHIVGRSSSSPFNAAPLCHDCHEHILHTNEEQQALFAQTLRYLYAQGRQITETDEQFMRDNPHLLVDNPYIE